MPRFTFLALSIPFQGRAYAAVVVAVTILAGYWQLFVKAGRKGWESLVPGWNLVIFMRIIGRPAWWVLGLLAGPAGWVLAQEVVARTGHRYGYALALPGLLVSGYVHCRVSRDLARSFGRSRRFAWRLILLPFVYLPVLGFGYSEYQGPGALMRRKGKEAAVTP